MKQEEATELVDSLFRSWGPCVFRYAWRLARTRELADDLVQEAFMALYRELRHGKPVREPRAWTLQVVRNQFGKQQRSQRRHGEELVPQEVLDAMPLSADPPEGLVRESASLASLLSVLSPREEEVIVLRLQSLKYREIAAAIGISPKSVATLLARALLKLRMAAKTRVVGQRPSIDLDSHARKTLQ